MTPENFVYWLQGYFEILNADEDNHPKYLTNDQTQVIKDHLKLVFEKKTPTQTKEWVNKIWGDKIVEQLDSDKKELNEQLGIESNKITIPLSVPVHTEIGTPILDNRPEYMSKVQIPVSC